jgi:hypothetical protein
MKTREEIEAETRSGESYSRVTDARIIIEVLLDIRDLLQHKEKPTI